MTCRLPLPEAFGALYCCEAAGKGRAQHDAAHALLQEALPLYGAQCALRLPEGAPALGYIGNGKPVLRDFPQIAFNLSHCAGLAVCLFSETPCGVDAEPVRRCRERTAARVCSPAERAMLAAAADPDFLFTRLWTLKESYVKALGIGISYPLRKVSFAFEGEHIVSNQPDASFAQLLLPSHTVSVCVLKRLEEQPVLRLQG